MWSSSLATSSRSSKRRPADLVSGAAVAASGTTLTDIVGIGPVCAAIISGDRPRNRLNPRGNRKLKHAIHIAAICQLRYDTEGRAYHDRKTAEGKISKEAVRALKRRISDRVYRHLIADANRAGTV